MSKFTTAAPYEPSVTTHTHQTAPTQFIEAKGIRFAYRRFGKAGGCLSSSTSTTRAPWITGTPR